MRHKARHPSNADSPGIPSDTPSNNAIRTMNDGCSAPHNSHDASCSCPQREVSPPRPSELPFPCTPENNKRMKAWLLDRYAASTFNTCPLGHYPAWRGHRSRSTSTPLPHPRRATRRPTYHCIGSRGYTMTSSVTRHLASLNECHMANP